MYSCHEVVDTRDMPTVIDEALDEMSPYKAAASGYRTSFHNYTGGNVCQSKETWGSHDCGCVVRSP